MKSNKFLVLFVVFVMVFCISALGSVSAAGNNSTDNTAAYKNTTGQSQYTGPQTNTTKWTNSSLTSIGQVTVTKNGTIYIQGGSALYAFNPNGTLLWSCATSGSTTRSAPVVGNDGTIYASNSGSLYAVYPNGTKKWTYNTGIVAVTGDPVLDPNGIIYFTTSSGRVFAIDTNLSDPSKADPKWMKPVYNSYLLGAVLSPDGKTLYCTSNPTLYALNTVDGSLKWNFTIGASNSGIPVLDSNGIIYWGVYGGMLYAIIDSGDQPTVKWNTTLKNINSGVAIGSNGMIYVGSASYTADNFYALNHSDGSILYTATIVRTISENQRPVIGSDGTVYVGSVNGYIYAFNPDLTNKWIYTPTGNFQFYQPTIGPDGTLYIGSTIGFYAFQDLIGNFNSTPVSGLDVSFTDTSSNIPTSWNWDFGDGTTSIDKNPTHTYSAPGKYNVTLTVGIASDVNTTVMKEITVNLAPTLDPIGNKTSDENQSISFTVVGHDTPDDNLTYSATGLPDGATLDPNTGAFSWTPNYSQAGTYHITFTVSDDSNLTFSETITIVVNNVNRAPVICFAGINVDENQPLNFSLGGSDEDGDALTYSATGLPAGATFNSATGAFSWIPSHAQVGTYIITFTVFDGNATDTETITINVKDNVAPTVTKVDPAKNAVVKTAKAIKITFNETIKNGNLLIDLKNSSGKAVQFTTSISGNTLTITPKSTLASGKYSLGLHTGAITDLTGNALALYSSTFTVDNTAPTMSKFDPANGATRVYAGKTIKVTFNESIKAGSLFVELKNSSGKAIAFASSISGKVLTIDPKSNLAESLYTLSIHTGAVTDLAGNPVAGKSSKFSVGTAPIVSKVDPKNGVTKVARSKTIKVTFNEAIKAASGSKYWVELKTSSGKSVKITKSISGKVLSIGHAKLAANTKYKLLIHSGAVTDKAVNPIASKTYTFTTGKT